MNKLKMIFAGLAIVSTLVAGVMIKQSHSVQAAEAAPSYSCDVAIVDGPSNNGLKVSADGKTISATVVVTGSNANCDRYATIAVWKSNTASGQPLSQQVFFGNTTKKLSVGRHTLTATLPQCTFWQADLLGQKRPKSVNGDANYQYPQDMLANFKLGGKKCTPPPTKNDVCVNIDGMQDVVPDGYTRDENGVCTIKPGVTPTTPAPVVTGETITVTGPSEIIAAVATTVTALGSGAAHFVLRRKF